MSWRECATIGCRVPATMAVHGCSMQSVGVRITAEYCAECASMVSRSDLVDRVEPIDSLECAACLGDGELGAFPFAWCTWCRGTGLTDHECSGCGQPTALDTLDRAPLDCVGVVVHVGCDTGHSFFDRRPEPIVWGSL